jgi:acetyl-CoA synthetase
MSNMLIKTKSQWSANTFVTSNNRMEILDESTKKPTVFWKRAAERITWIKPFTEVSQWSFKLPVQIQWYADGTLNVSQNCIDRHLKDNAKKIAFNWIPENKSEAKITITYKDLSEHVNRLANALKVIGVKKGDRVTIYMPMIPEAVYSMLACARIGAIHSVIFGGFSASAIADRIQDCESEFVITADGGFRGGKKMALKNNVDEALKITEKQSSWKVKKVICVKRTDESVSWVDGRDLWYHDAVKNQPTECEPTEMKAEDPLFILYTSGSTGKPKGVLHTTGGYLTYVSLTHEMVFDYKPNDIYWCAADIGWVTGHSYIVYGPLSNCATSLLYEGLPTYPSASRLWEIIDDEKVSILYTAPTLIRALMREGEKYLATTHRKSLRILGSVGEPINPEAWLWYYKNIGHENCPIVDTWWQTETGGILISPLPGGTNLKPGSASFPLFGIEPILLSDKGEVLEGEATGHLCLKNSWPGQMRTVYKNSERFNETYFSQFPGYYYTGDECRRDEDGYLWIIGRADDVINVSGHRLGTAEIESALVAHHAVAESAVVGCPHDIKGQAIYAFVTLKNEIVATEELKKELVQFVRKEIGSIATPEVIQWAPQLPKTRSGKIMRRILKKIAAGDVESLGDITTLADPNVIQNLVASRKIVRI